MLVLILWGSFQHKRCARQNDVGPYFVRFTSTQKMCLTVEWWSLFCKVHCYRKKWARKHDVGPYTVKFIFAKKDMPDSIMLVLILWGSFLHKRCDWQHGVGPYSMRFISTQKMWLTVPVRECLFLSFAVLINNLCPSVGRCWCLYVGSHLF